MKKSFIILIIALCCANIYSIDWNYYGSLRMMAGYDMMNEDMMVSPDDDGTLHLDDNESKASFFMGMQNNSRLGFLATHEDYSGKIEIGVTPSDFYLRHFYLNYKINEYDLLIGKTETGFNEFASQVRGGDNALIGQGMFYAGRVAQVRVTTQVDDMKVYFALLQNGNFSNKDEYMLLPKINAGVYKTHNKIDFHLTTGLSMKSYNHERTGISADVFTYAFALTAKTTLENDMKVKVQLNYGQNVCEYGIYNGNVETIAAANDSRSTLEYCDTTTLGGYLDINQKNLHIGVGYISSENDIYTDPVAELNIYTNYQINLHKNLFLKPELGMTDKMEDGHGVDEGQIYYFVAKLQANL